jgi:hypothetical protein
VIAMLALVAAGAAGAAASPVVPAAVQTQIARRAPQLAYVPTRMLLGFRYRTWKAEAGVVRIWFRNRAGWEITFVAAPLRGGCRAGMEKSFQLAGNKVYWGHRVTEQEAWRCVPGRARRTIRVVAASAQPPTTLADVGLGRVVASARRVG